MSQVGRPSVSIDVLSPVDVAQIFQSVGEYIAIHEPVLDEFGTLIDAKLIWWNNLYQDVRVLPVSHLSKMSEAYFEPEIAIGYASTAWSSGSAVQIFEFTPAKRVRYRPAEPAGVVSVKWERVGDHIVEVGSDLSDVRRLESKLADQRSTVFAAERDKALVVERERIARNLHDNVIQQIYASSLGLSAVAARLGDFIAEEGDTHTRLQYIVKTVAEDLSSLITTIRNEIFEVRQEPAATLQRELEDAVLPIIGPSTMDLIMKVEVERIDDAEIVSHLKSVVREAVSNAVRHSQGSSILVSVHKARGGCLHLVVDDDGQGMSSSAAPSSGLRNMEERASALGGSVRFIRTDEGGTRVSWRIPVPGWAP